MKQKHTFILNLNYSLIVFMVAHVMGFARLKGGMDQLFADPDPEDLMAGLRVYGIAVLVGGVLGGLLGRVLG